MRNFDRAKFLIEIDWRGVDFARAQSNRRSKIVAVAFALQFGIRNNTNCSIPTRSLDPDDLAPTVFHTDEAYLIVARLGGQLRYEAASQPLAPGLFSQSIQRIDAAEYFCPQHSSKGNLRAGSNEILDHVFTVVFDVAGQQTCTAFNTLQGARYNNGFEISITQQTDRNSREQYQPDHRNRQASR